MLQRVVALAEYASRDYPNIGVCVATDNAEIQKHAQKIDAACVMTSEKCATGSDRALAAAQKLKHRPDFILNLQGDAPFTEPLAIKKIIEAFHDNPEHEVVTPVHNLSWRDLDRLREAKKTTPFSGTTAILTPAAQAVWFSKNILPAIRGEEELRTKSEYSPVYQHVGLYGYRTDILEKFCASAPSPYETLEGLEQLRLLENDIKIQTVDVDIAPGQIQSGIDSQEDIDRAERRIEQYGDPMVHQKTF